MRGYKLEYLLQCQGYLLYTSNLKRKLVFFFFTAVIYEQQKQVEILEHLMVDKKTEDIRYLTLFLVGPPNVGKTTTRDRLLKIIENIEEEGDKRRVQSTLLANSNQVLAFLNGDEWLSSDDAEEEAHLLFGFA